MSTPWSGDAPVVPEDAVEVGRIVGPWGVKGGIKVLPYSNDPQALFSTKRWFLLAPDERYVPAAARQAGNPLRWPVLLRIVQAREHGDGLVATAHDLNERSVAEALKGARILVSRASFPTADANEFYWVDLIGLSVFNREGHALGSVIDLLDTGAHSVLRVNDSAPDGVVVERLIPFVDAYIDAVDLAGRRIVVDWLPDWDEPAHPASPATKKPKASRSSPRGPKADGAIAPVTPPPQD